MIQFLFSIIFCYNFSFCDVSYNIWNIAKKLLQRYIIHINRNLYYRFLLMCMIYIYCTFHKQTREGGRERERDIKSYNYREWCREGVSVEFLPRDIRPWHVKTKTCFMNVLKGPELSRLQHFFECFYWEQVFTNWLSTNTACIALQKFFSSFAFLTFFCLVKIFCFPNPSQKSNRTCNRRVYSYIRSL